MSTATAEPELGELEQAWVDDEFAAIIAASFRGEYVSPPVPPTDKGSAWNPRGRHRSHDGPCLLAIRRVHPAVAGYQRSPPRA